MHSRRRLLLLAGIVSMPLIVLPVVAIRAAEPLRVMSCNIRYGTAPDGDNEWSKRKPVLLEVVRKFNPDLLAVQEALDFQIGELEEELDGFAHVGVGRDDGKKEGEYSAILYRTARLKPTDSGTFWFSTAPDTPGSKAWGANFSRICTWAAFEDLGPSAGVRRQFRAYNVHWDHESQLARENSGTMLAERIANDAGDSTPVIVTGDFNAGETNPAFTRLLGGPAGLADTYRKVWPDRRDVGTYHGYAGDRSGEKIDAILASRQWDVVDPSIITISRGKVFPSDHFPVVAVLALR